MNSRLGLGRRDLADIEIFWRATLVIIKTDPIKRRPRLLPGQVTTANGGSEGTESSGSAGTQYSGLLRLPPTLFPSVESHVFNNGLNRIGVKKGSLRAAHLCAFLDRKIARQSRYSPKSTKRFRIRPNGLRAALASC